MVDVQQRANAPVGGLTCLDGLAASPLGHAAVAAKRAAAAEEAAPGGCQCATCSLEVDAYEVAPEPSARCLAATEEELAKRVRHALIAPRPLADAGMDVAAEL